MGLSPVYTEGMSVIEAENRFVTSASWQEYLRFLDAVGDRPIRVTYDRGSLEIMSPSNQHERVKSWLRALLEGLLVAKGVDYMPGGSVTFRREDLQRGLEPDECYWIAQFQTVRNIGELDLLHDPPPDLVLEIDISRSSLDRIELYRCLQVPEVWRYHKTTIEVYRLQSDGSYTVSDSSAILPEVPMREFLRHLEIASEFGITRAVRTFCSSF